MTDSDSSFEEMNDSEDFREHLLVLKAKWKAALKKNKKLLLKCPNYERCQSKCGSVGGMQYHYERCTGNAPRFKCDQCDRTYESRTGLNYHMASSHINEPSEDNKSDSPSRPQRSAALNTMSAMHISSNPPSLKQSPTRTPPKLPTPKATAPPKTPPPALELSDFPSPPKLMIVSQSDDEEEVSTKPAVKKSSPSSKATPKSDGGTDGKGKKTTKYVTIPSIEYPDEYKSFLPVWRHEMKENKIIKCPNYKDCDFKCTTVNGMKYHYVRCGKANPPEFNCELCGKKFQCRTGLVWHLKKTHKLIDIQPSKGGGFKGTLPAKLVMGPVPQDHSPHPRKKIKLSDSGRENRSPIGHKPQKSFSRRKRYTPHKTPEEILQNVVMFTSLPSPKLGPQAVKEVLVPLSEYHIYENIPTDDVSKPSTIIQLGEEALTWQRMSSDSESEGEYNSTELIFEEEVFGGYRSSNSLSDSDDDYMYGASKKKQKHKSNGPTLGVRSAAPRRGRPPKNRDVKDDVYEPISMESLPSTFNRDSLPPPLLTEAEQKPALPQMPPLIKTPDATSEEKSLEPYTTSFYKATSHVQPPPGLILPVKSEHSARHSSNKLPEPPPLLKNSNASDVTDYPHIVLPSNSPSSPSWTTTQTTGPTHTAPALGRPGRPGRPPRSKTGGAKDKKATTVRTGSTTAHFRSSRGSKGQSSSYSTKGMKMTQYEFSSSSSSMSSHSITNSSPSQSSMVTYGTPSSLQNIVAPIQIIQGIPTNSVQVQGYQSVQPGGMMLMQGTRPLGLEYAPQQSPSYITQDGQTYQIIQAQPQHLTMSDAGDNSQKVSVIMQPSTATYTTQTTAGGIQYLTQLDGPPPLTKTKEKTDKATLKSNFEKARKQEQAKLKQSSSTVSSSTSTEVTSQSRASSAEISSEDKMSKQLKMYLDKEVGRKPKQTPVPTRDVVPPKSRRAKSISVDRTLHVAEKSPKLQVSQSLFSSSGRNVDSSIGIHTLLNNPSSKTPVKKLNTRDSTSSVTGLFQPDNIQTIKPADTRHCAATPELGEAKMPLEMNFNQSNSNDNSHSSDSGNEEVASGSSSKTRPTKRRREMAAASSLQKGTASKGKKSTRGKGRAKAATTSEDSASVQCIDLTEPSPKKKARSNAKTKGNDKEASLAETSVVVEETLMKLGKRSRQRTTEKPLSLEHCEMDTVEQAISESQLSPEDPLPVVDSTIAPSPAKKKRGPKKSGDVSSEPGPSSGGSGKGRKSTGGKKFQCDKCDAEYSSKKSLVNHIASVHAIQLDANTPMAECVPVWRRAIKIAKAVICCKCGEYKAVNVEAIKYHWNRCNKDEESFTVRCPHCDKEYRSEAGLKYHLRYTHISPPPQPSRSPSLEAVRDPSKPLPPRRAATKATKKMAALIIPVDTPGASLPSSSSNTKITTPSPSPSAPEVGVVSITAELRAAFIRKEIVECPHEGCEKTFKTLPGLKYHMARHRDTNPNKFQCPVCKQVLKGVKRFENHIKGKHPNEDPELMNVTDHEYVPGEEPDDSDGDVRDDWEAEKDEIEDPPKKSISAGRSHKAHLAAKWVHNVPTNYGGYRDKVREVWSQLYEGREVLAGEEWTVKTQHWRKVSSKSDLAMYLPECKQSMPFVVATKAESEETEPHTLSLFSACEGCEGVTGAVMYTGGPVWSMDWLPVEGDTTEHYVALTAYKGLDEIFQMKYPITQPGLLQFWRVGALTNEKGHTPTTQFVLGLAHNYGVIRDMKWCPSVRWSGSRGAGKRLGVLGVACSDGTVRILVILQPEELSQQFSEKANKKKKASASSPNHLIVSLESEAALLVPSGAGISDWSEFGQCLCLDWLPGNKYTRIAAGYSNGVVCVWDLENTCVALPALCSREKGLVIHPMTQLTAHKAPCKTVSWCPHDHNYIFTGGYDKCGCLWDLRQPYSPLEKQEKGMLLSSKWPLLWNEVLFHSDGTAGAAANSPVPCLSYHHASSGSRPSKNLLHCSAPITSVSYCHWSDRVAAGSYSGEVGMVTLPSHLHLSNVIIDRARKKGIKREIVWLNHREPVSPTATPTSSAPPISELVQTHRLILTPSPGTEVLQRHSQLLPDDTPLQATTKVVWSPNESSYEWMMVGSNTGLVQLLHIQAPIQKPARFFSTYCYQSTVC